MRFRPGKPHCCRSPLQDAVEGCPQVSIRAVKACMTRKIPIVHKGSGNADQFRADVDHISGVSYEVELASCWNKLQGVNDRR